MTLHLPPPKPRPYQIKAVESTLDVLFNEKGRNPIIAMPTGSGKSPTMAWTKRAILQRIPQARIINMTHTKELITQDSNALRRVWPQAPYGIYAAGLNSKQSSMQITFASIMSAVKNLKAFGKQNIMMIDEAHLLSPNEETSYQRAIKAFREENPDMPVVGYTATPFRLGSGLLAEGNIFNCTAFDNTGRDDFVSLIDDGYLCPLIPKPTNFKFDLTKVRKIGQDYNQGDLQQVMNDDEKSVRALNEAMQIATRRRHIMVFCSGIDHVESVASILDAWGERVEYVHSKQSTTQRDQSIERFTLGVSRWIVNDGILTTGFDCPFVDCIVLLRPTISVVLHIQILGRGTRPYYAFGYSSEMLEEKSFRLEAIERSEKQNCLVLDFAGNTDRLGPINDPRIPKKKGKGTGEVPIKICPNCGSYVHAAQRFCDGIMPDDTTKCNYEFQFDTKIEQTAATAELIVRGGNALTHWFPVDRVEYEIRTKPFSPTAMRVKYYCGMRRFTEVVCLEHQSSYAGKRARDWWRERLRLLGLDDIDPPPNTVEGMTYVDNLPKPTHIFVHLNASGNNGRMYESVTAYSFDGKTETPDYSRAPNA